MTTEQTSAPIFGDFVKYDILIEVKTLCRKNKTTSWTQLVQDGFAIGDHKWGEDDLVIATSGVGHARMGLLASYMTDMNRHLNPSIAKAILPEMEGSANGLGHIVLVGYKEGSDKAEPLITVLFEFTQQPGGKIKVSKAAQDYFAKEAELKKTEVNSAMWMCDLYAQIEAYKDKHQGTPLIVYTNDTEVPAYLRGRKFSPSLSRTYFEAIGKTAAVINIREHTPETEGVIPPYLFSLFAEEGDDGKLWITYGGEVDLTEEQDKTVQEVLLALKDVVTNLTPPHGIIEH
jgi:hypothetical protein